MSVETVDVAIVGAGVSGLSAAYELRKRKRSVTVLEREPRPGGVILTERVGEFVVDRLFAVSGTESHLNDRVGIPREDRHRE